MGNDNKLNHLGFRFANLVTKYLKINVIFNDIPCYPLCQLSKDVVIDVLCIGENSEVIETNDFVWNELFDLSEKIKNNTLEAQEDEVDLLLSQSKGSEETTELSLNKDTEVKKVLEELQVK